VHVVGDRAAPTGDTLFVERVGRPGPGDQASAFAVDLYDSRRRSLLALPDQLLVLPGHSGDVVVVRPDHQVGALLGDLRDDPEMGPNRCAVSR